MKILITGFPTMGGSGLIAARSGLKLAERGHDVHFVFYKKSFFLEDTPNIENATFHQLDQPSYALFRDIGPPYTIQAASKISQICKDHSIDVLHSHYAIPHAVSSYLASKIHEVKTVVTTHGSDTHTLGKDLSYNSTIGLALQNTSKVTSVSKYLAKETEEVFKLPENSVKIIYDFIDTDEFRPAETEKDMSIVQASNFRNIKQTPFLIEIFADVVENFPNWKLKLIGNGPDWPLSVRIARRLKIKDNVEFLGVRKDIPNQFSKASILASTSAMESFGITLAEAMSCETAVLAPNVGGIPEVCINNKTGLLYEPNSKEDAVEKLSKLVSDQHLRQSLGKNAREYVLENFNANKIVQEYEELYEEIVNDDNVKNPTPLTF